MPSHSALCRMMFLQQQHNFQQEGVLWQQQAAERIDTPAGLEEKSLDQTAEAAPSPELRPVEPDINDCPLAGSVAIDSNESSADLASEPASF